MITTLLAELIGLILSGKMNLQIGIKLSLSHAAEDHEMLEGRKNIEKLILKPQAGLHCIKIGEHKKAQGERAILYSPIFS